MIGTIRKHSKILWAIVITIVIVSFVFWDTGPRGGGGGRGDYNYGAIYGQPVKAEEFADALREIRLLYFLQAGDWPSESARQMGFDVERETYFRILMVRKVKEAGIHVDRATAARVASEILRSFSRGQLLPLDAFEKNILARGGLKLPDFERYVRHLLAIEQLRAVHGVAGRLVTPAETRRLYERENEALATEAVFFHASNYLATVAVTPDAVGQFFTNQMARYRLPERVVVSYVAFDLSNHLAAAEAELTRTNFSEMIEARVQQVGTNFYAEATTPEEIRAKAREELLKAKATLLARQAANEFATAVDAIKPAAAVNLETKAAERNLPIKVTEPFDQEDGPKEIAVGADFIRDSFNRTAEEPIAGPLAGQDAVYVIALKARVPSEIPPFADIRARVEADYTEFQAAAAARRAGGELARVLTNGLAEGKTFSSLCAEASVNPVIVPPVALSTRTLPEVEERISLRQYQSVAFSTPVGKASQFVPTMEGGFVVFVREKLPVDLAKMTAEMPTFAISVRQTRQNEAFNEWFRREAERGLREIPIFRQQSPPPEGFPLQ